MQLPFFRKRKEEKDFFLTLLVKPYSIGVILFEEQDKNLLILSTKEEEQGKEVSNLTPEELVEVANRVISFVEGSLPEGTSVNKTIFAVPHNWVEEGRIKKEYLLKLKKVCEELELTPIGFIVSIEAIVSFLQKKEGAPISAIFVEIAKENVFVYIVRGGSVIEIKEDRKEEDVAHTVENLLGTVEKFEVLPSKIILFDSQGAEKIQQEFLSRPWTKNLPFLHLPQVVILEKGFENEAVVSGVATQMGFDVLHEEEAKSQVFKKEEKTIGEEQFGFLKDQDVAIQKEEEVQEDAIPYFREEETIEEVHTESDVQEKLKTLLPIALIQNVAEKMSKVKFLTFFSRFSYGMRSFTIPILFLFLLVLFIVSYYTIILRGEVIVFTDKKLVNKNNIITLSSSSPTSLKDLLLNITNKSEDVEQELTSDVSGKKETGEKAHGELTIYNKTEQKKTLTKGTILIGRDNLEFTLSDDVYVSSTSAFSTTFSNIKAKVEASKFGPEYNLTSGTNFTFKDFPASSYFAKNESAFLGGSKKTIQVVSAKDLENLQSSIIDSLKEKVLSRARAKTGSDESVLLTPLAVEFREKKFDKKEGDEARKVKLSAKLKFKIGIYKKSELEDLVKELSKAEIPEAYTLVKEHSKIEIKDIKIGKDDVVSATLNAVSFYRPTIDVKKLTHDLRGKSLTWAEKHIKDIPGISDVIIRFKNKVPLLPALLPLPAKNIIIEVKTND